MPAKTDARDQDPEYLAGLAAGLTADTMPAGRGLRYRIGWRVGHYERLKRLTDTKD